MSTDSINLKPANKRPKETKFKQQKLPAWQPILTADTVLPLLFAIGISFIPLGIGFLVTASNVREKIVDYTTTNCVPNDGSTNTTCADTLEAMRGSRCYCTVAFQLSEDFPAPVMMYYSLTNFYQNHRRYVKSRDDNQLHGADVTLGGLATDCAPFRGNGSLGYAPCGAIANSMFNDTLSISFMNASAPVNVSLINTGIAWSTDKNSKFQNPPENSQARNSSLQPPYWQKSVWDLQPTDPGNNGYQNEDLIVWMRTAALPNFRKLYRRINHDVDGFRNGLPAGNYSLHVVYAYPVTTFGGTKRMILSTTSWLGGRNPFLGLAYIIVGSICLIMGCVFLVIHINIGKRSKRHRSVELSAITPYYDPSLNTVRNIAM